MVGEKIGGGWSGGRDGERMEEMWLPFRWRLRRAVREVKGEREEREVRSLNSRLREVSDDRRGEEGGIAVRWGIWLLLARRMVRSGKEEARVTISDQERSVSSSASSLMPLNAVEALARSSEEMLVKRLPLAGLAMGL